jgi:3-phenylpropionate/trans-cinnamate dioxygenase ferredoxin reductase component
MSAALPPASVVIVGAGQAGAEVAAELRRQAYSGPVTIVGAEPFVPYKRPPLSKTYLAGAATTESLYVLSQAAMEKANVQFIGGTRAVAIDRANKSLRLADDRVLPYDRLVLATGGRPRRLEIPGADLPGIHVLRGIADVDAIRQDFVAGKRLAIVGGGYIGLEVAAVAVKAGLSVTVLESMPRVLQRVTAPEMSAFYERVHREAGVDLRTGVQLAGFEAQNGAIHVKLVGGDVEADMVIVGIGLIANTELASEAGLAVDNGIVVDEFTATSDPSIYAAGDCTNHPSEFLGRRVRLESVQNAMEQGRAVASNLLGKTTRYSNVPWFWSDQYELKLQMVGMSAGFDQCVLRGDPAKRNFGAFYFKDGVLIAADTVSRPQEFMLAKKLVAMKAKVDPARIADEGVAMKDIVPA